MAVDGGADGIVAPYVETAEEVRAMVGAVHYRPIKGRQLHDFLNGVREPASATRDFLRRFNLHRYVIIGIESVTAYENLDALIGIEGVDGVFIGPHDLSVSLEAPEEWDNPALHHIFEDTIVRCRAAGIGVGNWQHHCGLLTTLIRQILERFTHGHSRYAGGRECRGGEIARMRCSFRKNPLADE